MAAAGKAHEPWIEELAGIADHAHREDYLSSHPELLCAQSVDQLYASVVSYAWVDVQKAERLAETSHWIAVRLDDPYASAQSARATGHVFYLTGKYRQAIEQYERALAIFQKLGRDLDYARTINGALQSLSYDGQYDRAFKLADEARNIFLRYQDQLRLGRLDSNVANLYYRQDRFLEAVELYEGACETLLQHGEPLDVAILLRNLAVCYISLNEFTQAEKTYQAAREHCEKHGLVLLQVKADYNIAYLYYLRGEYLKAIELYDQTRALCDKVGDQHHKALCDLDESEIYLELNLTEGGAGLAREAFESFGKLGMKYEAAKAAAFFAIAVSQQGRRNEALELFDKARELFVREQNLLWPALIDLYKALVLYEAGDDLRAEELAHASLEYFAHSTLPAKAAVCEMLLAEIELRSGETEQARRYCNSALARLLNVESPAVYQAHFLLGQTEEACGNSELARQAYERAYGKLEELRSHLGREELKISFLKNKVAVYEGLVLTSLAVSPSMESQKMALQYIEQSKSRSLADLIAFRTSTIQPRATGQSAAMGQFRELSQKLNWTYHQIELEELNAEGQSQERLTRLRQQGRQYEADLVKAFSQLQTGNREFAQLQSGYTVSIPEIQAAIPKDALLLEYYEARGQFYAAIVGRDSLRIMPAAESRPVRERLRMLQLQLAKFRLGPEYLQHFQKSLLEATRSHLRELYELLIAPLRQFLNAGHLVVVPHRFLHYLPFHALGDGGSYLIDEHTVSYAPSASIFAMCQTKNRVGGGDALVLGVPDSRAPHIAEEVSFVAEVLGATKVFLGEEASEERLREYGPSSRFIHIATHGYFRQDNPMFSAIRLGRSMLSLFDLYQLQFDAELVTLSGCGTGMNVVVGGDELIGLVRGLLYAGAQSLLVSLWEIHDQSTATFMKNFYDSYRCLKHGPAALRKAMMELRLELPHPYYWAAFSLVGKVS